MIQQLPVITEIGNNASDSIAKIKPEVEKFAHRHGLKTISCVGSVLIAVAIDGQGENFSSEKTIHVLSSENVH